MIKVHWALKIACIIFGCFFISALHQMGPWGPSFALGVGAIGLGNAMASEIAFWWERRQKPRS